MAPLGASQDAKTTNGSGELLGETGLMEVQDRNPPYAVR
jgi:hypothetical protein